MTDDYNRQLRPDVSGRFCNFCNRIFLPEIPADMRKTRDTEEKSNSVFRVLCVDVPYLSV